MLHWLWTCFRQPVEPRCNSRFPCVTSLYTGGSSTSPSHLRSMLVPHPIVAVAGRMVPSATVRLTVSSPPMHSRRHAAPPSSSVVRLPCLSPNFRESWRRVGFATDAHGVGAGSTSTARSRRSRWPVRLCGLAGDDRLPLRAAGLCCSPGGVRPSVGHVGDGVRGRPLPAALRLHTRSR